MLVAHMKVRQINTRGPLYDRAPPAAIHVWFTQGPSLTLSHDQNLFSLEFAALGAWIRNGTSIGTCSSRPTIPGTGWALIAE